VGSAFAAAYALSSEDDASSVAGGSCASSFAPSSPASASSASSVRPSPQATGGREEGQRSEEKLEEQPSAALDGCRGSALLGQTEWERPLRHASESAEEKQEESGESPKRNGQEAKQGEPCDRLRWSAQEVEVGTSQRSICCSSREEERPEKCADRCQAEKEASALRLNLQDRSEGGEAGPSDGTVHACVEGSLAGGPALLGRNSSEGNPFAEEIGCTAAASKIIVSDIGEISRNPFAEDLAADTPSSAASSTEVAAGKAAHGNGSSNNAPGSKAMPPSSENAAQPPSPPLVPPPVLALDRRSAAVPATSPSASSSGGSFISELISGSVGSPTSP